MAQSVFDSGSDVKRSVSLYTALPEEIVVVTGLTGRKHSEADIESLAADIYKNGQDTPVLFRKNDAGKPVLVYGHRRRLAIAHINKHMLQPGQEHFRVQGKYEALDELGALTAAIGENRFRKDVSAVDDAHNIGILQKRFKLSVEQVAGIYFPEAVTDEAKAEAVRWVKVRAGLTELADEAKEAVREGVATVTAAAELAKLPKDDQREIIAESKAKKSTLKGKARIKVADVKAAKAKKAGKPVPAAKGKAPAKAPVKVSGSVYEAAEAMAVALDAWLTDATDKAEKAVIATHKAYRSLVPLHRERK